MSSGNLLPDSESLLLKRSLLCDAAHLPTLTTADLPMNLSSVRGMPGCILGQVVVKQFLIVSYSEIND